MRGCLLEGRAEEFKGQGGWLEETLSGVYRGEGPGDDGAVVPQAG